MHYTIISNSSYKEHNYFQGPDEFLISGFYCKRIMKDLFRYSKIYFESSRRIAGTYYKLYSAILKHKKQYLKLLNTTNAHVLYNLPTVLGQTVRIS